MTNLFVSHKDLISQFQPPFICFGSDIGNEIIRRQAKQHARAMSRLDALAEMFLSAANGDSAEAERKLDDTVDLLLESGCLSSWKYRIVLAEIREGLKRD